MRFAADENFDGTLLSQLLRRFPTLDIVRVQDTEMYQSPDSAMLEWAANEGRIVLSHDEHTLIHDAYARVKDGLAMPGVVIIPGQHDIGSVLEDLELAIVASKPDEFNNRVVHIPL